MNNTIKRLYKNGYTKAFNITYDDGILQDVRFIELLNRYGLKGTFNLNSGLMQDEFVWTHETGLDVKRLSVDEVRHLYDRHEAASHTLTHPYFSEETSVEKIMHEMTEDKQNLETIFEKDISGFALPFNYFDSNLANCAKAAGFKYCRISDESLDYDWHKEPYQWKASMFHLNENLPEFIENFCQTQQELALCQISGHSYDLDVYNMWEEIEQLYAKVAQQKDVWFAAHIELAEYLEAMKQVKTDENGRLYNPTNVRLWFSVNGCTICI